LNIQITLRSKQIIPRLLEKVNKILIAKSPVFPIGGIRSRAIELNDYYIPDGEEDDAFVHYATLKIGAGQPDDIKKATCDELFAAMKSFCQFVQ
jgi:5-carboxymethyl-2-hydroxymuconate isomerase